MTFFTLPICIFLCSNQTLLLKSLNRVLFAFPSFPFYWPFYYRVNCPRGWSLDRKERQRDFGGVPLFDNISSSWYTKYTPLRADSLQLDRHWWKCWGMCKDNGITVLPQWNLLSIKSSSSLIFLCIKRISIKIDFHFQTVFLVTLGRRATEIKK